jgi:beta-lactamase class A
MSFFDEDPHLQTIAAQAQDKAAALYRERGVPAEQFALVLLRPGSPGSRPRGASLRADWRSYPCSLVKVFFLVAAAAELDAGRLQPHEELDRAMRDMILWSSNTATNYIIDLVTGTTGDTLLAAEEMTRWCERREAINRFFAGFGWPELAGINLNQKLMDDLRYGREKIGLDRSAGGHNALTPLAMARLMHALFHGEMLSPGRREQARDLLARDLASPYLKRGAYQVTGYLAAGLPEGSRIWSKAGRTRWLGDERADFRRHDALRAVLPNGDEFILTVFTQGEAIAEDDAFLPMIAETVARGLMAVRPRAA